jgi:hypothetical protein
MLRTAWTSIPHRWQPGPAPGTAVLPSFHRHHCGRNRRQGRKAPRPARTWRALLLGGRVTDGDGSVSSPRLARPGWTILFRPFVLSESGRCACRLARRSMFSAVQCSAGLFALSEQFIWCSCVGVDQMPADGEYGGHDSGCDCE